MANRASERESEPETVDRFKVLSLLGQGGMGVVYEAYDGRLDRKVALKLVRAQKAEDGSEGRARLLREARALAKVAHPNVVAVYETGEVGAQVFIAMELVPGETLKRWLERAPRGFREVLALFVEAGRGLAAAHARGVIHRDFKPDNVLVGEDGRARVVDFGLARGAAQKDVSRAEEASPNSGDAEILSSDLTVAGTMLGTPTYMSPEHFKGKHVDAKSDQFSFAVSLYRALFGVPPHEGDSLRELCANVCMTPARAPPTGTEVPEDVLSAVMRALATRPADRFPSMDELLDALARPLAVDPEHDPLRSRRSRRLAVTILGGSALATLIALAVTGHLVMSLRELLVQSVLANVILLSLFLAFRRTFATAYNRKLGLVFAGCALSLLVHRVLALHFDAGVPETLAGDAIALGLATTLAAITLERWMLAGPVLVALYLAFLVALPRFAAPGFGVLVIVLTFGAFWNWADPKAPTGREKSGKSWGSSR